MLILRAPRSTVYAALLLGVATLTGCIGTRLSPETPKGVELQGVWRLNRAASDDPQKLIDKLKAEALKRIRRAMNAPPPLDQSGQQPGRRRGPGGSGGSGGSGGPVGNAGVTDQPTQDEMQAQMAPGGDPLRNSPTMHELRTILQRSDYLTIRQSPDQVGFDYGTTARSYTPGAHSVVSSENGVADQSAGWSGKQFVVNVKPQLGPQVFEQYELSPDGKQLIVTSRIGPFELSRVILKRVYDATGAAVPNSRPSTD
jgi:hypothetical protein